MRRILLLMLGALTLAYASTPKVMLVIAVSLDGIIIFDPAESFETVSNSSLRNIY